MRKRSKKIRFLPFQQYSLLTNLPSLSNISKTVLTSDGSRGFPRQTCAALANSSSETGCPAIVYIVMAMPKSSREFRRWQKSLYCSKEIPWRGRGGKGREGEGRGREARRGVGRSVRNEEGDKRGRKVRGGQR